MFGKNLAKVREEILNVSQTALAKKLGTTQVLLSRLENGLGGDIKTILSVVSYLSAQGYPSYLLFVKKFKIELFVKGKRHKQAKGSDILLVQFGNRLKQIRSELVKINIAEFAKELGATTRLYGRLEEGIGGNIHIVFSIIDSLNIRGYKGEYLFAEPFKLNNFYNETPQQTLVKEFYAALDDLKKLKKELDEEMEKQKMQLDEKMEKLISAAKNMYMNNPKL